VKPPPPPARRAAVPDRLCLVPGQLRRLGVPRRKLGCTPPKGHHGGRGRRGRGSDWALLAAGCGRSSCGRLPLGPWEGEKIPTLTGDPSEPASCLPDDGRAPGGTVGSRPTEAIVSPDQRLALGRDERAAHPRGGSGALPGAAGRLHRGGDKTPPSGACTRRKHLRNEGLIKPSPPPRKRCLHVRFARCRCQRFRRWSRQAPENFFFFFFFFLPPSAPGPCTSPPPPHGGRPWTPVSGLPPCS